MSVDPQAFTASFFNVLKTSSSATSAAVRAALGDGANSVIPAEDMRNGLPVVPFVALRGGPMPGAPSDVWRPFLTWWIYDGADRRFFRINGLVPLILACYPKEDFPINYIDVLSVALSEERPDPALGLPVRSLAFQLAFRG